MSFFTVSKVFELWDTFFIVVRKRPLILLHWYHHVTVLCVCPVSVCVSVCVCVCKCVCVSVCVCPGYNQARLCTNLFSSASVQRGLVLRLSGQLCSRPSNRA